MEDVTPEAPAWYLALDELVPVGSGRHVAFIRRDDVGTAVHAGVEAALVAAFARLDSIDGARRRYVDPDVLGALADDVADLDALHDSYVLATQAMESARVRLDPGGGDDPALGVFAASVALSRLAASFKSAHLLYQLGHATDGHAIMRVVLEQIAWAYAAAELDHEDALAALEPTKAFKKLKRLYPGAGRIYWELSQVTHLDLGEHRRLVARRGDRLALAQTERAAVGGSTAMLVLCDIWLSVWEATQVDFLDTFEHVVMDEDGARPDPDRPFKRAMLDQLDAVDRAVQ